MFACGQYIVSVSRGGYGRPQPWLVEWWIQDPLEATAQTRGGLCSIWSPSWSECPVWCQWPWIKRRAGQRHQAGLVNHIKLPMKGLLQIPGAETSDLRLDGSAFDADKVPLETRRLNESLAQACAQDTKWWKVGRDPRMSRFATDCLDYLDWGCRVSKTPSRR